MARFHELIFWLGGVMADPLTDKALEALQPGISGAEQRALRAKCGALTDDLLCGKVNPYNYCRDVGRLADPALPPEELQSRLLASFKLKAEVAEVVRMIPNEYRCWLISDLPREWFDASVANDVAADLFGRERVVFTADLGLGRIIPDIFKAIPAAIGKQRQDCLVIDGDAGRAVESVVRGLASIIYVYPRRLKHELALQKILLYEADVLHPARAERVAL